MFSKEEIAKAIEATRDEVNHIRTTDHYEITEINILKFIILNLENYLDREEIVAKYIEWQKQHELDRCAQFGRHLWRKEQVYTDEN